MPDRCQRTTMLLPRVTLDALTHARGYAIFQMDPEGRVVSWTAGAEHLLGYAADELRGREMHDAIAFHLEGLQAAGEPIPEPSGLTAKYVTVAA